MRLRRAARAPILMAAALLMCGVLLSPAANAATPTPHASPRPAIASKAEHPTYGPPQHRRLVSRTDQLASPAQVRRQLSASRVGGATAAPFLTRPYWHPHSVTSVFDHCNPDYSVDGRICDSDGNVALASNGVDPTFNRGYALHPGAGDYLYYDGHNGWDLALNYEPVLAAADGSVTEAANDDGFGTSILIDHGNGFSTRYSHLSQLQVGLGQVVSRGQQIAISGNTGNSTGPHLHFGVYVNSSWTAIDPYGYAGPGADPWPADMGDLWIGGNPQDPTGSSRRFGPFSGSPALLVNQDGHLEAFGRADDGAIIHSWEGSWGTWMPVAAGPAMAFSPASLRNSDGRGEIFAAGTDGRLYHTWQPAWPGWTALGAPGGLSLVGQPAPITNLDGHPEVFARGSDGAYWHSWRLPSGGWSGWSSLGGSFSSDPAVAQNADGHLEVFGTGSDGSILHAWFAGGWTPFYAFDGQSRSRVAVARNNSGSLEIFVVGSDRQLYHRWQGAPNGGWAGWSLTGPAPGAGWQGDPALVLNPGGWLEVFVRGPDDAVWHSWQWQWSPWSSLGGVITSNPAVTAAPQRSLLSLWAKGTDQAMYENYSSANLGWSGWTSRGGN